MKNTSEIWNDHYNRVKSKLLFPDENLVRILSKIEIKEGKALDFGAGSGRHSILLKNFGFNVTALDYSENSLSLVKEADISINTVLSTSLPYPFKDNEFDILVSWGVLHYNSLYVIKDMIKEYHRIIKNNCYLAGTIRADRDTHLKIENGEIKTKDLEGAKAILFSKNEVLDLFKDFKNIQLGYMERTPLGKLEERISHWIFLCKK